MYCYLAAFLRSKPHFGRDDRSWTCLDQFPKLVGDRYPTSRLFNFCGCSVSGQICGQNILSEFFWKGELSIKSVFSRLFGLFKNSGQETACMLPKKARYRLHHTKKRWFMVLKRTRLSKIRYIMSSGFWKVNTSKTRCKVEKANLCKLTKRFRYEIIIGYLQSTIIYILGIDI